MVCGTRSNESSSSCDKNNNDTGDAVFGTLLGVAAGAALHYAFSSRAEQRPSATGRSLTAPVEPTVRCCRLHEDSYYGAPESPPLDQARNQHLLTLEDNEDASTIRSRPMRACSTRHSRGTFSSQLAAPTAAASEASRMHRTRTVEDGPHPLNPSTSYKAPVATTSAEAIRDSSEIRSRRDYSHHARRSDKSDKSEKTFVRVTEETTKRTSSLDPHSGAFTLKAAPSTMTTIRREKRPEGFRLPPSRASTWTASYPDSRSPVSSAGRDSKHTATSKRGSRRRSENNKSSMTKSVIGKLQDAQKLHVTPEEVKPEDSVSQVSTVWNSRR